MARKRLAALILASIMVLPACSAEPESEPEDGRGEPVRVQRVEFTTSDGIALTGRLFEPEESHGMVVMAHQQDGSMDDWTELAVDFAEAKMSVFTFTFRGYQAQDGEKDSSLDVDLAAAVQFVRDEGFDRIALLGAGSGATAALHHAEDDDMATVVGLSPAREFGDLTIDPTQVEETVALFTARGDVEHHRDTEYLVDALPDAYNLDGSGDAHGVALLAEEGPTLTHFVRNAVGSAFFELMRQARASESG